MDNSKGIIKVEKTTVPIAAENRGRPKKYPFAELSAPEEIHRPGGGVEKQYYFFFVPHKHPSDISPSLSHWLRRNPDKKHVKIKMRREKLGKTWGTKVVRMT